MEKTVPVYGYESWYNVTYDGTIISYRRNKKGKKIKLHDSGQNHLMIEIKDKESRIIKYVHDIVWESFNRKPVPSNCVVHHKDKNPLNNRLDNLECISRSKHVSDHKSIKIIQCDLQGNPIREWDSAKIVQDKLGIFRSTICCCLKGKSHTAGGFKWKYKDSE